MLITGQGKNRSSKNQCQWALTINSLAMLCNLVLLLNLINLYNYFSTTSSTTSIKGREITGFLYKHEHEQGCFE